MSRRMVFGRYDFAAFGVFIAYAVGSLAVPTALVQVAESLNFPLDGGGMAEGGWLHMLRSLALTASMLTCGFMAARWGNRKPLGFSVLLIGFGMVLCAVAPHYGFLVGALIIAGFGEGIVEGLATPFVQRLHLDEPGRYVNFSHAFWSIGVVIATVLFGALLALGVSWRIIMLVAGLFTVPPALLLMLPERKKHYPENNNKFSAKEVLGQTADICKTPQFWLYFAAMFLAGGGEFCLTFWGTRFIQLELAGNAMTGGIGLATFATGMFLGRTGFGFFIHQRHLKRLLLSTGALAVLASMLIPWIAYTAGLASGRITEPLAWLPPLPLATYIHQVGALYIVLFITGIGTAPFWPSIQSRAVEQMPRLDATMVFVLLSCAGFPGCGYFSLLMGYAGGIVGLTLSFFLVPVSFLVMTFLILMDGRRCV
ncbi:MAG: MFS transporter [Lentisphaerae bacterium]|nr:MFS transporter [Lentisphaerota bacterium]